MRSGLNGVLHWIGMLHWSGTKSGLTETVIRKPAEEQQTSAVTDAAKVRVRRLRSFIFVVWRFLRKRKIVDC